MKLFCLDNSIAREFYERDDREIEPEKRLMLAILEDAVWCFKKYLFAPENSRNEYEFRGAEDWILDKNNEWLFSFNNICDTLGFNSSYIRHGLMRFKEKQMLNGRRKIA